jgi:hypothetical protein
MSLDVIDQHLEKQSSAVKIRQSWQHPSLVQKLKSNTTDLETQKHPEVQIQETKEEKPSNDKQASAARESKD